jgi:hypothetical protein
MDNAVVIPVGVPADFGLPGDGGGDKMVIEMPHDCGSGAHGAKRPWELGDPGDSGVEGVSDASWRDVERLTAEAIAERQRTRGDVAGGWVEWADTLLKPKVIPWDQELGSVLRGALHDVAGDVFHSYKRPSRRQSAFPDIIQPSMRKPRPFVCIIGDTSMSMDQDDLAYVRGVVNDICMAMAARVAFLATDRKVHKGVQLVQDGRNVVLAGRGGTNMAVGMEYAMSGLVRPRPERPRGPTRPRPSRPSSAPSAIATTSPTCPRGRVSSASTLGSSLRRKHREPKAEYRALQAQRAESDRPLQRGAPRRDPRPFLARCSVGRRRRD